MHIRYVIGLAVVLSVMMFIGFSQNQEITSLKSELSAASTSIDEYEALMQTVGFSHNIAVVNSKSLNVTALQAPVKIELIMPIGITDIQNVQRDNLSVPYSIITTSYPETGLKVITFTTAMPDHFKLQFGQQYDEPVTGVAMLSIWADNVRVDEPMAFVVDGDSDHFAVSLDITTVNEQ